MQMKDTFLPKNKHDIESVEALSGLERSLVLPLLPKLLEWLQDFNWPIASGIVDLLSKYKNEIIPHIEEILSMHDMIWSYNILTYLIQDWDTEYVSVLSSSLRELAQTMDYDEGTDLLAIETLWSHRLIEKNVAAGLLAGKLSEIEEGLQSFTLEQKAVFSDLEDERLRLLHTNVEGIGSFVELNNEVLHQKHHYERLLRRYKEIEVLINSIADPA
ncbi:DUF5071 domain-containing protein [Paenibacillus sp. NPDC058174]|uniref:DUF5071 domain-containing protein n=1 Tax=Paenibacillus sp. NPDC058174 TaxID=3346366 RepID=UPI0036DE645F